ncbi:MAG TPA: helix-turn-helix transcriptional regulator [Bryobacteraceae bacterium]|nr:helix-turn-helix transcriptional regulator [Bryobacteraceae bacterium]
MRQSGFLTEYDPKPGVSIATLAYDYPPDYYVDEHSHGSDQLIHATRGVMEISSGQSSWLIPPHFAIWIPERMPHRLRMRGAVSMRTLYLRKTVASRMPRHGSVLQVSPLLKELIVEAVRIGQLRPRQTLHRALQSLIVSELERAAPIPSFVTLPKDRRAQAVAEAVMSNRDGSASLAVLSKSAGASVRTVERAFRRDTGLSFESWRRQFRLMKAIGLLVEGRPVKEVAFEIGYRQPSAFVQMFRSTLGATPKAWISALRDGG